MTLHHPGGLLHCLEFNITPLARVRAANFMRVTEVERARDREAEMKKKKRESARENETWSEKGDIRVGREE